MRRSTKAGLAALGAAVAAAIVLPLSCGGGSGPWDGLGGPPRVVATFAPLDCFVQNVGGSHVAVLSLCTTDGPHDADPGVLGGQMLQKADLFVLNGLGLEDRFALRLADASNNPKVRGLSGPGVVNLGDRLLKAGLVDKFGEHDEHEEHGHAKAEEGHGHEEHGEYDPHVWLGIPQAIKMVESIRDALDEADPAHKSDYDRNAAGYIEKLKKLHEDGKAALEGKKNRKIVTSHDSLHYFAESFGIEVEDVIDATPGTEPDPQTVARLVEKCRKEGVRVIATEPQFLNQGAPHTLLKELQRKGTTDAELIVLDPLETVSDGDKLDAGWYERRMRFDLDELKKALR
jgi:ABC-type Zn uptake system ZnuABC Zn-binding protein ZnuA